jgi:hypothetical protein
MAFAPLGRLDNHRRGVLVGDPVQALTPGRPVDERRICDDPGRRSELQIVLLSAAVVTSERLRLLSFARTVQKTTGDDQLTETLKEWWERKKERERRAHERRRDTEILLQDDLGVLPTATFDSAPAPAPDPPSPSFDSDGGNSGGGGADGTW